MEFRSGVNGHFQADVLQYADELERLGLVDEAQEFRTDLTNAVAQMKGCDEARQLKTAEAEISGTKLSHGQKIALRKEEARAQKALVDIWMKRYTSMREHPDSPSLTATVSLQGSQQTNTG